MILETTRDEFGEPKVVELTAEEAIKLNPQLKETLDKEINPKKKVDKENNGDANAAKSTKDKSYMQSEKMLQKMKMEWEMLQKGDPNALDDAIKA